MYRNVWKCMKCLTMYEIVWKCTKKYEKVWNCMKMYEKIWNVWKCMKYMKMYEDLCIVWNVWKGMYAIVWNFIIVYQNVWKMYEDTFMNTLFGLNPYNGSIDFQNQQMKTFSKTCHFSEHSFGLSP